MGQPSSGSNFRSSAQATRLLSRTVHERVDLLHAEKLAGVSATLYNPDKQWIIWQRKSFMSVLTRSSADAEKPARRHITRREERYRQLVGRCTTVSYAEGVLTYRQAAESYITYCHCSALRPKFS